MTFRVSPTLFASAFVCCALASACSSKDATPRSFVDAQLSSGASKGSCNFGSTPLLQIGGVPDGGGTVDRVNNGGPNNVTCSVKPSNGGFAVQAEVDVNTQVIGLGGSLRISGNVTESGGSNIAASMNVGGTLYSESDCTIEFNPNFTVSLGDPPAPPSVAAGRIWGTLVCPNAAATANGSQTFCVATADFVFENCGQ